MTDKGQLWYKDFEKLKSEANKVHTDLKRWELLGSATQTAQKGGGERAKLGADLRVRVVKLKNDVDRLKSLLEMLPQQEATQKTITQWRDDLALVSQEIQESQQRVTRKASQPSTSVYSASSSGVSTRTTSSQLDGVSNRALLDHQQQTMRDIEQSLTPLEGTVNNLNLVGNMISREIREQNTMLEKTNAETDRVLSRMDRVRSMVDRVGMQDRTRCLACIVIVLAIVLIVLVVQFLIK